MVTGTTWDGSECRLTSSRSTSRVSRTRPVPCSRSPPTINTWRKFLMSKSLNQVTEFSPLYITVRYHIRVFSLFITVRFQSFLPFVSQSGIWVLSLLFYSQVTEFSPLSFNSSHQNFQISQLKDCFSHQILKRKVCNYEVWSVLVGDARAWQ